MKACHILYGIKKKEDKDTQMNCQTKLGIMW